MISLGNISNYFRYLKRCFWLSGLIIINSAQKPSLNSQLEQDVVDIYQFGKAELLKLTRLRDQLAYFTNYLDSLKHDDIGGLSFGVIINKLGYTDNFIYDRDPIFNYISAKEIDSSLFRPLRLVIYEINSGLSVNTKDLKYLFAEGQYSISSLLPPDQKAQFERDISGIKNATREQKYTLENKHIYESVVLMEQMLPVLLSQELLSLIVDQKKMDNLKNLDDRDLKYIYLTARGIRQRLLIIAEFIREIDEQSKLYKVLFSKLRDEVVLFKEYINLNEQLIQSVNSASELRNQIFELYPKLVNAADKFLKELIYHDINAIKDEFIAGLKDNIPQKGLIDRLTRDQYLKDMNQLVSKNEVHFKSSDSRDVQMFIKVADGTLSRLEELEKVTDVSGTLFLSIKYKDSGNIISKVTHQAQIFSATDYVCGRIKYEWRRGKINLPPIPRGQDSCTFILNERASITSEFKRFEKEYADSLTIYANCSKIYINTGLKVYDLELQADPTSSVIVKDLNSKKEKSIKIHLEDVGYNGRWEYNGELFNKLTRDLGISNFMGLKIIKLTPDLENGDLAFHLKFPWKRRLYAVLNLPVNENDSSDIVFKLSELQGLDVKEAIKKVLKRRLKSSIAELSKELNTAMIAQNSNRHFRLDTVILEYDPVDVEDALEAHFLSGSFRFTPLFIDQMNLSCPNDGLTASLGFSQSDDQMQISIGRVGGADGYKDCIITKLRERVSGILTREIDTLNHLQVGNLIKFGEPEYDFDKEAITIELQIPALNIESILVTINKDGLNDDLLKQVTDILIDRWKELAKAEFDKYKNELIENIGICNKRDYSIGTFYGYNVYVQGLVDCQTLKDKYNLATQDGNEILIIGEANINSNGNVKIKFVAESVIEKKLIPKIKSGLRSINKHLNEYIALESPRFKDNKFSVELRMKIPQLGIPRTRIGEIYIDKDGGELKSDFDDDNISEAILGKMVARLNDLKLLQGENISLAGIGEVTIESTQFEVKNKSINFKISSLVDFAIIPVPLKFSVSFLGEEVYSKPHVDIKSLNLTNYIDPNLMLPGFNAQFSRLELGISPFRIEGTFSSKIASIFTIPHTNFTLTESKLELSLSPTIPLPSLPVGPFFYLLRGTIGIDTNEKKVNGEGLITMGTTPPDAEQSAKIAHLNCHIGISYGTIGDLEFNGSLVLLSFLTILEGEGALSIKKGTAELSVATQGIIKKLIDYNQTLFIDGKNLIYQSENEIDLLGIAGNRSFTQGRKYGSGQFMISTDQSLRVPFSKVDGFVETRLDDRGMQSLLKNLNASLAWDLKPVSGSVEVDYFKVQALLNAFGFQLGIEVPSLHDLDLDIMKSFLLGIFDFRLEVNQLEEVLDGFNIGNSSRKSRSGDKSGFGDNYYEDGIISRNTNLVKDKNASGKVASVMATSSRAFHSFGNLSMAKFDLTATCLRRVEERKILNTKLVVKVKNVPISCRVFNANYSTISNHPDITTCDYIYLQSMSSPCSSNGCSGRYTKPLDYALPNNHINPEINLSQWAANNPKGMLLTRARISPGLLKFHPTNGAYRMSFLDQWLLNANGLNDKASIIISNSNIDLDKYIFRVNMINYMRRLHFFLSYELNDDHPALSNDDQKNVKAFLKTVLLPAQSTFFSQVNDKVPEFPVNGNIETIFEFIKNRSDDPKFREILDDAIINYMTSLGNDIRERADLYFTDQNGNESFYQTKYQFVNNDNLDLVIRHDIDDNSANMLQIDKNESITLFNDDVVKSYVPNLTSQRFVQESGNYKNAVQNPLFVLNKHILFQAQLNPKVEGTYQQYGKIGQYYLFNVSSSRHTIKYLKKISASDNFHHLHYVSLNASSLGIPSQSGNPVMVTNTNFFLSKLAFSYFLKEGSFNHLSKAIKSGDHIDFYEHLNKNAFFYSSKTYIDIGISNDGDTLLLGATVHSGKVTFFHESKKGLIVARPLVTSRLESAYLNYLNEPGHELAELPKSKFKLSEEELACYNIVGDQLAPNLVKEERLKYQMFMRLLKGFTKNRTWIVNEDFQSSVTPISTF